VEVARERFGITMPLPERRGKEQPEVARFEEKKNPVLAAAWAEGRAMTLEQAIEYALAPTEPLPRTHRKSIKSAGATRAGLLAPRERAVAALIAEGKTNKQIAASLSITESTAATHVNHILNKLGVNSRAQIAAWAVAHGLAAFTASAQAH
jgi:non-specific serine/threonine protein kinase